MSAKHRVGLILIFLGICGAALVAERLLELRRNSVRPGELYEVVRLEIDAVREADFPRAYQQVSTGFQEKFNVEAFAELVRSDYPEIRSAERIEFGRVVHDGRRAVVQVFFTMPDGDVIPCVYSLVNEENAWKIDSARVQTRWPAGRRLGGLRS